MLKVKNIIDFKIIWEKIHNVISKDNENLIDNWVSEKKLHKHFFEDVEKFYAKGSVFDETPVDIMNAWNEVSLRIKNRKKNGYRYLVYASVAASIIFLVSLIFIWNKTSSNPVIISEQVIEPGVKKAKLILNDGSVHDLSKGKELLIEEGGVQLKSYGTTIEYSVTGEKSAAIKYNTLKIPRGGEFLLKLSDGTKVWLNSETTLRYPLQFPKDNRKVELIGEAYFEVVRNKTAPFKVISGGQVVEVLGTSFNISSYKEDSIVYTTLVEGRVSVSLKHNPETTRLLLPNDQSLLLKNDGILVKRKVEATQYILWKDGRFYFKDQQLTEIMKTLSRWYDVDIIFENKKAGMIKFTGDLKRYENFENILSKIERTQEVKFHINDRTIIVE